LESLGYHVKWKVLNVVDFAVPQNRRRLILIASKTFVPEFAKSVAKKRTVRDAIGNLTPPRRSRNELHNYKAKRSEKIAQLIKKIPHNGGSRMALGKMKQLACHRRLRGFWDVYGRMAWSKPSPTITGGCLNPSKGRFLHPVANRPITLHEAALLQTFPKTYRFVLDEGRYATALLIGNALPPEFIRRHAAALRTSALEVHA
jgi:DNA (cytosine-5)-methyltransferase 1